MYALLRHKTTHEVRTLLPKQPWSSSRENIPFENFEVTFYATLDTKRKNGVQWSKKWSKNWSNAKQSDFVIVEIKTDKESKKIDPYCCAIKAMVEIPPQLKTVGHVLREISRHIFLFKRRERKSRWFRIFYAIHVFL